VGSRATLDLVVKKKILAPAANQALVIQSTVIKYMDLAI
jgi:hypothetical protein